MTYKRHLAQQDRRREEFFDGIAPRMDGTTANRPKIALRPENATVGEFRPPVTTVPVATVEEVGEWLVTLRFSRSLSVLDFNTVRAIETFPTPAIALWMMTATTALYQEALLEMAMILNREDEQLGGRARVYVPGIDEEI